MKRLQQLRDERGQLVTTMRALLDKAAAEKRDLNDEEQANYDRLLADQAKKADEVTREERQVELDRQMAQTAAEQNPAPAPKNGERINPRATDEYRAAFGRFLQGGIGSLSYDEVRALQADVNPAGGFLVAPEQFVKELIKAVDDQVWLRQWATKFQVADAQSLGVPSLDADPADADWTSEILTGSEDSTMAFGKRELHPHPLAKRIKVSNKLLRTAAMPAEQIVRDRLAYKFGITEEKAFLLGTGASQPLGVFVASASGIPTTRDVSSGNTTTSIGFDGLINAKFSLKSQYLARARWLFHRDAVSQISKLKDAVDGQYLWQPSTQAGTPDLIHGVPVFMSEYVPNTFTTGLYVGMIADFSNYWIADAMDMQVQRLLELYAETNQVGFIGRKETDGMPVLGEAFARVKLA